MNNMLNIEVYLTKNYTNNCFIRKSMDNFVMSYIHKYITNIKITPFTIDI